MKKSQIKKQKYIRERNLKRTVRNNIIIHIIIIIIIFIIILNTNTI